MMNHNKVETMCTRKILIIRHLLSIKIKYESLVRFQWHEISSDRNPMVCNELIDSFAELEPVRSDLTTGPVHTGFPPVKLRNLCFNFSDIFKSK